MKKIYIVDLIGAYCGMHYYDNAFKSLLEQYQYTTRILSNYKDKHCQSTFFPIIFGKNTICSISLLIISYIKFIIYLLTHKGTFIYLSYGEKYDIPFLFLGLFSKKIIIDIHEVYALKYTEQHIISKIIKLLYKYVIKSIIYHSSRTLNNLQNINYKGNKIFIKHFDYNFPQKYNISNIAKDVQNTYQTNKLKFLFFGNLSIVKGIDIIIKVFSHLKKSDLDKVELVIAGKNVDAINFDYLKKISNSIHVIDRHINDDELIYLYQHTDFILLPYRKSSQSGIAAMGIYFQKPMIFSKLPYFEEIIKQCPPNSIVVDLEKYGNYILCLIKKTNDKKELSSNLNVTLNTEEQYKQFIIQLAQLIK